MGRMMQRIAKFATAIALSSACVALGSMAPAFRVTSAAAASQHPKVLYLTFDDGPSERYTPQILNILRREHIHATFFVLGSRCASFPHLVRRELAEGHEIGNHGYAHQRIASLTGDAMRTDIIRTDTEIFRACKVRPVYYRPPEGVLTLPEMVVLHQLGHSIALWSVDSQDWKTPQGAIIENVRRGVRPGSVILFHDGVSNSRFTVTALPVIIRSLRQEGYQFQVLPVGVHQAVLRSL